jgi:hypothetical protein
MQNLSLDRNHYEALHSLLAELEDIEAPVEELPDKVIVSGKLTKDNINLLRDFCGMEFLP